MGALYRVLIELNKMCSSTPIVNLPDYFRYEATTEQCIVKLLLILDGRTEKVLQFIVTLKPI
jgi:hypothetical protein